MIITEQIQKQLLEKLPEGVTVTSYIASGHESSTGVGGTRMKMGSKPYTTLDELVKHIIKWVDMFRRRVEAESSLGQGGSSACILGLEIPAILNLVVTQSTLSVLQAELNQMIQVPQGTLIPGSSSSMSSSSSSSGSEDLKKSEELLQRVHGGIAKQFAALVEGFGERPVLQSTGQEVGGAPLQFSSLSSQSSQSSESSQVNNSEKNKLSNK